MSDRLRADALSTRLKSFLVDLDRKRVFVAYSGGVDSTVLLHVLWSLRQHLNLELIALHADHQLHDSSREWHAHCQSFCANLGIPFQAHRFEITDIRGIGMEAAARNARYSWFLRETAGAVLVTGHNQDDQAETVLFRLVRGSGAAGLAAISQTTEIQGNLIARPLLYESRADIQTYAMHCDLPYIKDDSNCDVRIDRNYIRHQIMPLFRKRWPAVDKTIARAADHLQSQRSLTRTAVRSDLQACKSDGGSCILGDFGRLKLDVLTGLGAPRMADVLRYWVRQHRMEVPNTARLMELIRQIRESEGSRSCMIRWRDGELRTYRSLLHLVPPQPSPVFRGTRTWATDETIDITAAGIRLRSVPRRGQGLRIPVPGAAGLILDWRQTGEKIRPNGSPHIRSVKNLFQQAGIPPWERIRIPRIYVEQKLVCIPGLAVDSKYAAQTSDDGHEVLIEPLFFPLDSSNRGNGVVQPCGVW